MDEEYEYAYSPTAGVLKVLAVSSDMGDGLYMVAGRNGNKMETWTFYKSQASFLGNTIHIERPVVREWIKRGISD